MKLKTDHLCCTKFVMNSGCTKGGLGCLKPDEYSIMDEGNGAHFGTLPAMAGTAIAAARKIWVKSIVAFQRMDWIEYFWKWVLEYCWVVEFGDERKPESKSLYILILLSKTRNAIRHEWGCAIKRIVSYLQRVQILPISDSLRNLIHFSVSSFLARCGPRAEKRSIASQLGNADLFSGAW